MRGKIKLWISLTLCVAAGTVMAAGLGPQSYAQDGLVTQFDVLDNEGTGTYNPSAATWRDLKGSAYITLQTGASWTGRYLDTTKAQHTMTGMPAYRRDSLTIEVVVNIMSNGQMSTANCWPRVFAHGDTCTLHSAGNSSSDFRFYMGGVVSKDYRPYIYKFRTGTAACYSCTDYFAVGVDGTESERISVPPANGLAQNAANWTLNGHSGFLHGHYHAFRMYNRMLSPGEIVTNAIIDKLRFWSHSHAGTGAAESWSDLAWAVPEKATGAVPSTLTNDYVQIANATVGVSAADHVGLAGLSLEDGAKLDLASDAVAAVKILYVEGVAVPRGVYTGTGPVGTQVSWLAGDGILGVAGSLDRGVPSLVPTPAADGWYEFGLASGYGFDRTTGYSGNPGGTYMWITGDHPTWDDYAFPAGAKLRLVGGILLETVPAGVFSEYDMSGLKVVYLHGTTAFADGTPLTIPSGCTFRFQSGTWKPDAVIANRWWLTAKGADEITYAGDIVNNGTFAVTYDGEQAARQTYTGDVSGTGKFYIYNFGKQARFQGRFDMLASAPSAGFQNGCLIWIDTLSVGGSFTSYSLGGGTGQYGTNTSWSANGFLFGKDNSDETADNELFIGTLTGNGADITDVPSGKRWRSGGHVIVWGNNTVHVGDLRDGLHVVARRQDQHCNQGWLGSSTQKGVGNLVVDTLTRGNIYASTNVNLKIGTVASASTIDYTYQSGAINRMTLDITNSCNASAVVKATDIGMLPTRISGFTGTVTLTDTETVKSYTMPVDFTQGTNCLYNTTGCIGSGTLGSAPASGMIDVTFPTTGVQPVKGDYALARFTSGGDKLGGWTVTLNGQSADSAIVAGMKVDVRKDATGLWLKVQKPGVTITIR